MLFSDICHLFGFVWNSTSSSQDLGSCGNPSGDAPEAGSRLMRITWTMSSQPPLDPPIELNPSVGHAGCSTLRAGLPQGSERGRRRGRLRSDGYVHARSGSRLQVSDENRLRELVEPGATTSLIVDMVAPRSSGRYTTAWALWSGENAFCRMSLTIAVR